MSRRRRPEIPYPSGSEQADLFTAQMDDIGLRFEDHAKKNFEAAVALAKKEGVVNEWSADAERRLAKYRR